MALDLSTPMQKASASATAAGVFLTLPSATFTNFLVEYISYWTIVIDTLAGAATGTPTVAALILNPGTTTYVTPTKVNGATQAWSVVTAANDVLIWTYTGPLIGVQLSITTWTTPGGTVWGYIFGE